MTFSERPVVSVEWLAANIDDPQLIILDATIAKVGQPQLVASTDDQAIPGAIFFDLKNKFSRHQAALPNTCPTADQFQQEARRLGIDKASHIVVYDRHGLYSAARAWYLFKAFGHAEVSVLDGGLPAWIEAGLPVDSLTLSVAHDGDFVAIHKPWLFVESDDVLKTIQDNDSVILDARSPERFSAREPEPRAGIRSGHIPRSRNLHYQNLLLKGRLKSDTELVKLLSLARAKKAVLSCGSGVTACILALAAEKTGYSGYSVYDGSWAEWGSSSDLPLVNPEDMLDNDDMKRVEDQLVLKGRLRVPGDKSITQRAYIFSALADGISTVHDPLNSADANSCLQAVCDLGAELIERTDVLVKIKGCTDGFVTGKNQVIDCGNSGTAMRLLTGAIAGQDVSVSLIGDESLNKRPMERVAIPMRAMGADVQTDSGKPPIRISGGNLNGIEYHSPVASAQVKSCVLLAGLQATGETVLIEPQCSRDHTERMLPVFGAGLRTISSAENYKAIIQGPQKLTAAEIQVPADPSSAAFVLTAASLLEGSEVTLTDVCMNRGRTGSILALRRMGAEIELTNTRLFGKEPVSDLVVRSARLKAIHVLPEQVVDMLDEIPVLMLAAAFADGDCHFEGLHELRVKESDRLGLMIENLLAIGVDCEITEADGAVIRDLDFSAVQEKPFWRVVHDHRLAMTGYIAKLVTGLDIQIEDMDAATVSWPNFISDFKTLLG